MIIVGVMIVSFVGGFFAAVLCLGAKEEELLYEEAKKTWRKMDAL